MRGRGNRVTGERVMGNRVMGNRVMGNIASFDDPAGYGTVVDDDGNEWFFHCTAIADRTRTIEVGTPVVFDRVPGRLGRWEAADLEPVPQA